MMITPHAVVGAAVGSVVETPALAFLLGFVSHHILDALPHIDLNNLYDDSQDSNLCYNWIDYLVIGIDALIALLVLAVFYQSATDQIASSASAHSAAFWWGALGGVFPDLIDNHPWCFITRKWLILRQYSWLHHKLHLSIATKNRWFWLSTIVEILALIGGIWWLAR